MKEKEGERHKERAKVGEWAVGEDSQSKRIESQQDVSGEQRFRKESDKMLKRTNHDRVPQDGK